MANGTVVSGLMQQLASSFLESYVDQRRWILWKFDTKSITDKPIKVPLNSITGSKGNAFDSRLWRTLPELAASPVAQLASGVGLGLTSEDDLGCIDLDDCFLPDGSLRTYAQLAADTIAAPTERSMSGRGLHLWFRGKLPKDRPSNRSGTVEVYPSVDGNGWIAITGDFVTDVRHTRCVPELALSALYGDFEVLADALDDDEAAQLWAGDWTSIPELGSKSQSEADFVLCKKIAMHTTDPAQVSRLFRFSRLSDNVDRHANPDDYIARTVKKALQAAPKRRGRPRMEDVRELATWEVFKASDIEIAPTKWVWENRIPLGEASELIGDPDVGKSTLAYDIAARITTGRPMPDGTRSHLSGPAHVLVLSAEDSIRRTIAPRLTAAGADLDRVLFVKISYKNQAMLMTIPEDVERLRALVRDYDIKLIILDPLVSYLGDKIDSHRDASARRALAPLAELADQEEAAVLSIRHLNKDTGNAKAKHRGGGSIAFTAMVRSSLLAAEYHKGGTEADGTRSLAFVSVKNNLGPKPVGFLYTLERTVLPTATGIEITTARVAWGQPITVDADELLQSDHKRDKPSVKLEARKLIYDLLADGPKSLQAIRDEVEASGLNWSTVRQTHWRSFGLESVRLADDQGKLTVHGWKLPLDLELPDREQHSFPQRDD